MRLCFSSPQFCATQSCWMICTLVIAIGTFPYALHAVAKVFLSWVRGMWSSVTTRSFCWYFACHFASLFGQETLQKCEYLYFFEYKPSAHSSGHGHVNSFQKRFEMENLQTLIWNHEIRLRNPVPPLPLVCHCVCEAFTSSSFSS